MAGTQRSVGTRGSLTGRGARRPGAEALPRAREAQVGAPGGHARRAVLSLCRQLKIPEALSCHPSPAELKLERKSPRPLRRERPDEPAGPPPAELRAQRPRGSDPALASEAARARPGGVAGRPSESSGGTPACACACGSRAARVPSAA